MIIVFIMKQIFSFVSRGISGGYAYIRTHKMVGVFVCVAIVAFSYLLFFSHNDSTSTRYAVTKVVRGSVSTTILGSGQVSASNQVDITSEVSGTVLYVGARAGDSISSGKSIVLLDSTDAKRTVENAELNLENAKISYEKAQREFENQSKNSDVSDEKKSYENGHDTISTVFIALPDILRNVGDIYYTPTHSPYFADSALRSSVGDVAVEYKLKYGVIFDEVKKTHETLLTSYNALSDNADYIAIASLLKDTKTILQRLSTVLSGTYNTIDYVYTRMDTPTSHIEADKTELSSYISKVNTYSTNISNALEAIEDAKSSATNAELNLKSAKLSVSQAEASLKTAQENLAHHNISASFDGLVANISVESGDKINSGKSVATVITKKKVADITLNEVDVAKVVLGQKATLAFDAIDDVIVEATVSEIDVLGTVAQGVVTYTVKIAFDSDDDRIKPGMTVSEIGRAHV